MTLWGKQAESYSAEEHAVVAFKGARVGDFGGKRTKNKRLPSYFSHEVHRALPVDDQLDAHGD